eukprot:scaffold1667_cov98-Isochrysis_galbana.AAC.4
MSSPHRPPPLHPTPTSSTAPHICAHAHHFTHPLHPSPSHPLHTPFTPVPVAFVECGGAIVQLGGGTLGGL